MRYILSLIMALFPALAGDMPGNSIPSPSTQVELLRSVNTPAQKNNTVSLAQGSAEEYYKEEKKVEDVLATYYADWRR